MESKNKLLPPYYQQQKRQTLDQKVNQRQNTVCLEQQIYASPDNFTPMLLVMLETFIWSAPDVKLYPCNFSGTPFDQKSADHAVLDLGQGKNKERHEVFLTCDT